MSNTYKHKDYGKYRRDIIEWDEVSWGQNGYKRYCKSPRDSKTAKYIIQTLGHKRRRAAERKVNDDLMKFTGWSHELWCVEYDWYDNNPSVDYTLEFYDEGKHLNRVFSNPWDYY